MPRALRLIAVMALIVASFAAAQRPINQHPVYAPEEEEKGPWVEESPEPPLFPGEENLLRFMIAGSSSFQFFIDRNSISIGKDAVVRYTIVIKSPTAPSAVKYEGIRCETAEKKVYATGGSERTWLPARLAVWEPIENKSLNGYQRVLFTDFFCPKKFPVANAQEAIRALRAGIHPEAKIRR